MKNHELVLKDQKSLSISGVVGVDGMTDKQVDVQLEQNKLVVKGDGLCVNKLDVDNGNLYIVGQSINSVCYIAKNKAKAGLAKLFK